VFIFQKKSNQGFIALALPLFALFILLTAGIMTLYSSTASQMKKQYKCQTAGIRLQSVFAELAEEIEALNPQASLLDAQAKLALAAVIAAPEPASKLAAIKHLKTIKSKQARLRFRQESLFLFYENKYRMLIWRLRLNEKYYVKQLPLQLEFKKTSTTSDSPTYVRKHNFRQKQFIELAWRQSLREGEIQGSCKIDLVKESKWYAKINADKA